MRNLQVAASSETPEAYTKISQKLKEEMGEPLKFKRTALVSGDADAIEKLKRLQSGV